MNICKGCGLNESVFELSFEPETEDDYCRDCRDIESAERILKHKIDQLTFESTVDQKARQLLHEKANLARKIIYGR